MRRDGACSACRRAMPLGRQGWYCRECQRADDKARCLGARHCCHCGAAMPPGRTCPRCTTCQRAYYERRKRHSRGRPCSQCGQGLPARWGASICADCRSMEHRERRLAKGLP